MKIAQAVLLACLASILPACGSCGEPAVLSIRDQQVVNWINEKGPKHLHYGESRRIFLAIRSACRRVDWRRMGIYENVLLAQNWRESGFDRFAVRYDRDPANPSVGLPQVTLNVASIIKGRKVGSGELMGDIEMSEDVALRHLLSVGTVQAYNAGPRGATRGRGKKYSAAVFSTLQGFPWVVKKDLKEIQDGTILRLFAVYPGTGASGLSPGKRRDSNLRHGRMEGVQDGGSRSQRRKKQR